MNELAANAQLGLQNAWANIILFAPKFLLAVIILVAGYLLAKLCCKLFNAALERVGFDRLVERGGVKRALARTHWDASDILAKLLFYFVMLFALQLAFGVFGPNPVSDLLTRVIAYLPNIFVAGLIVIIAGAIASGVKTIVQASTTGFTYGRYLATASSVLIWVVGIFAALDQLNIAPAIVTGLFYAALAVIVGSAIVAIGGSGIQPLRGQWEKALHKLENASTVPSANPSALPRPDGATEVPHEIYHGDDGKHPAKPRFTM